MTVPLSPSPFPKLSQAWRFTRLTASGFAASGLAGLAHVVWADRTAIVAAAVAAGEVAYRRVFPTGKLSGWLATLLAAYRQIAAAAQTVEPAAVPAATTAAAVVEAPAVP